MGCQVVRCNGEEVAVYRVGTDLYAIADRCCHKQAKLHMGDIEDLGQCESGGLTSTADMEPDHCDITLLIWSLTIVIQHC